MYRKSLLGIAVLFIMSISSSYATLDADSVLYIPRVMDGFAPAIDGIMDPVWYSVTNTFMNKNLDVCNPPDDWFDSWGQFKLLYDTSNLYAFITIHDDVINTVGANTYEQDGIEIYFDGDNSKDPSQTYDGVDDLHLRINTQWAEASEIECEYGNAGADWGFVKDGIQYAFQFTDLGYVLELSIPLGDLKIEGVPGWSFGFEMQTNDNDEGQRESVKRWWSSSNNSWYDPTLFGNAEFDDYFTTDILRIEQAYKMPVIDGIMDEAWNRIPEFSGNTFVTQTTNIPDNWNIYERVDNWNDMNFDFRVMYNYIYLYFFFNVYDDMISTEAGEDLEKDGIELYFDGDNSKNDFTNYGVGYDSNDRHLRRVFSDNPSVDCACQRTEFGWTMEWKIPSNDLGWTPEQYLEIGFDVQLNDQDDPDLLRSGAIRWWGNDNNEYVDASMFGTAEFSSPIPGNLPSAFTFNATDVTETTCRLNGWVFSFSGLYVPIFKYGLSTNYDHVIPAEQNVLDGTYGNMVFVELSDLLPNTTYHYRIEETFDMYNDYGADKTFTTSAVLPVVHTLPAINITTTSALLLGEIDSKDISTVVSFQYGRWLDYGIEIPATTSPVSSSELTPVSALLTGLYPNSIYYYRIVTTSAAGTAYGRDIIFTTTNSTDVKPAPSVLHPKSYLLMQNYPNPANPTTNIVYELPAASHVKVTIYNIRGELVRTLYTGEQEPGRYPLLWDGADDRGAPVSSGLYFLRMDADGFMDMKKMMLIK